MIRHIPITPQLKPGKPYYKLIINYMIGDADGETTAEAKLSVDNILIEPVCRALDKLDKTDGCWGICLSPEDMDNHFKEGQITEYECDLLQKVMDSDYRFVDETVDDTMPEEFLNEFENVLLKDTEYSFLVYQSYYLTYFDENGVEFNTQFVKA